MNPLLATAATALCLSTAVLAQAPLDETSDEADRVDLGIDLSLSANWAFSALYASSVEIDHVGDAASELDLSHDLALDISLGMFQSPTPATDTTESKPGSIEPKNPTYSTEHHANLAMAATNPVAALTQIQLQYTAAFASYGGSGYAGQFLFQPVIPWKFLGKYPQIVRVTTPLITTPDVDGPLGRTTQLGDTAVLNFATFKLKGGMIAPAISLVIPTGSDVRTSAGKWQAGPGILYINTSVPKTQFGILAYHNWSFADSGFGKSSPSVSTTYLQPFITYHFAKNWFIGSQDIQWTYNWNSEEWAFPLGVQVGTVTKIGDQPMKVFIEPFYVAGNPSSGNQWGIKFGISLLFPEH